MSTPTSPTRAGSTSTTGTSTSRAKLSCASCRERKQKCDRCLPSCRRCIDLGRFCDYPHSRQLSRGKRKQVRELEAKLFELEDQIRVIGSSHGSVQPALPASLSGSEPWQSPAAPRVRDSSRLSETASNGSAPKTYSAGQQDIETPHQATVSLNYADGETVPDEPISSDLLKQLTTLYFDKAQHGSPMLHRSRYTSSLRDPKASQPPLFLQYAVIATGATYSVDRAHIAMAKPLYRRARALAEAEEMSDKDNSVSVAQAQCWLLLAYLEAKGGMFSRASISLSRSIRIAQTLHLHKLDSGPQRPSLFSEVEPPRDWIEMEERCRTWWVIYISDRLVFATSGLPAVIDDRHVHTKLPATEEGFQNGIEEDVCTLQHALREASAPKSRLATRVLAAHLFYKAVDLELQLDIHAANDATSDGTIGETEYWTRHQDIDNDLGALLTRLPPSLRLPRNLSCQHAVFVNVLIHTATMCLHKTAIRKARDHEGLDADFAKAQGRSRVLAAAAQILAVFQLATDVAEALRNPIQVYSAYIAALVFLEDFAVGANSQSKDNVVFLLETLQTVGQTQAVAGMLAGQLRQEVDQLGIL